MKGIVITTRRELTVKDFGEPLHLELAEVLGGFFEVVRPRGLAVPYVMLVDEEGLLKQRPILNPIGSRLYGSHLHKNHIVGTIVIMKEGIDPETNENDILGLSNNDIAILKKFFTYNFDLANLPDVIKEDY